MTKRQQNMQDRITSQYFKLHQQASTQADKEKSDRIMKRHYQSADKKPRSNIVRKLYCALDEGLLNSVKGEKVKYSNVIKPRYRCPICLSYYSGWKYSEMRLEVNPDYIAIVCELGGE